MKRVTEGGILGRAIDFATALGGELAKQTAQTARDWLLENAHAYLEGWDPEAVAALVQHNISLWDQILTKELRDAALPNLITFRTIFPATAEAADFLIDMLQQIRPDLAMVLTREYLESEIAKVERELEKEA